MSKTEKYIPLIEAAERLGWTYQRVRNWILTGKLDGEKRYGHWVVSVASVEAAAQSDARVAG